MEKRTSLENAVYDLIQSDLDTSNLNVSDNFYGPEVDIYNTEHGLECHITFLFKKPFKQADSDNMYTFSRVAKESIDTYFSGIFKYIGVGNSTIDNYWQTKWYYDQKKTKK